MNPDIESPVLSQDECDECSDSEEKTFFAGLSENQRTLIQKKIAEYQSQFNTYNNNQKNQKIQDVINRFSDINERAAEIAIESCRNNELLAIKRLLEDESYKITVIAMAAGESPLDIESILINKRQDIREALEYDPEVKSDNDENDNWEMTVHYLNRTSSHSSQDQESDGTISDNDNSHFLRGCKRSSRSSGHRDKKLPRLCLDDALIMLASLQGNSTKNVVNPVEFPTKKEPIPVVVESVSVPSDQSTLTEGTSSSQTVEPVKKHKKNIKRKSHRNDDDDFEGEITNDSSDYDVNESLSTKPSKSSSAITKEAELFRALSGSAAKKIPADMMRQLGWSDARIKAFRNREKNPNQYYYRFNDPGEPQATGKWSEKDKMLFLKLIREKGVDYQWGIFSMQIPGRVGYQCSNFYRQLIKEGVIKDENYSFDEDGKLSFKFRDKRGRSTLTRSSGHGRSRRFSESDIGSDNEIDVMLPDEDENVLPDYIEPMTMRPVVKPTISPYGHVMGYDSWIKILNRPPKNTCPFTKKRLTRRSLVKLNKDNIDLYRDKIVNVTGFDVDLHC